jgi:hypothetical protein
MKSLAKEQIRGLRFTHQPLEKGVMDLPGDLGMGPD